MWNNTKAGFFYCIPISNSKFKEMPLYKYADDLEVIGNIYDNPNLLTTQIKEEIRLEREIIEKIVELVNQGHAIRFQEDWGENTLTLYIDDQHTHCGVPDGSYEILVKSLHDTLVKGRGLTFV